MKVGIRSFFLLAMLGLTNGCFHKKKIIPDIQSIIPSNELFSLDQNESNQSSFPTIESVFTDQHLYELFNLALENNLDWKVQLTMIDLARTEAGFVMSQSSPTVDTSFGLREGRERNRDTSFDEKELPKWNASASTSWEIDMWGKWKTLHKSENQKVQATIEMIKSAEISLLHQIALTWYTLRFYQEDIKILENSLKRQKSTLVLFRQRFNSGLENKTTIIRQEAEMTELLFEKSRVDKNYRLLTIRLKRLLGRPLQAEKLKITPLSFAPSPIFPSILPTVALSQRPDIRAAESRLRSSLFLEKSSQLNLFPSLGLKLSGISMSSSLSNPWKSWEAQAGPFVDIPIWSPRRKHQVRVSKVKVELMEAEWKALIIRAVEEVERSTIAFSTISEQLELAKDMVNQANAVLAVTREKLESGIVSQLELLEDERRLFRAERKALTIKLEEYEAALDLSKSLGLCMIKSN